MNSQMPDPVQEELIREKIRRFKPIPTFEFLLVLTFMLFTIMLVVFPRFFGEAEGLDAYRILQSIGGERFWSIVFFLVGTLNGVAVLRNYITLRRVGLVLSAFVFTAFFINFMQDFPNFSTVLYLALVITCLFGLFEVRRTEL